MKLQSLLALADGYLSNLDLDGELDFIFRHQMVGGRLVQLQVTAIRDPKTRAWKMIAEAHDREEHWAKTATGVVAAAVIDGIRQQMPDWCKVSCTKS